MNFTAKIRVSFAVQVAKTDMLKLKEAILLLKLKSSILPKY